MTELALTKKQRTKKNQGGGQAKLPLRRKYERAIIEGKDRYGGTEVGNTRTQQEINEIRATLAMPLDERIARAERFIEELDKEAAVANTGTPEMRLSGSRLLDEDAAQLTDSSDHGQAVRQAVSRVQVSRDDDEPVGSIHYLDRDEYEQQMREAVQKRMKADKENYLD